jgi:DNA-binding NtrC family response regulator
MRSTDQRTHARSLLLGNSPTSAQPADNWRQCFPEIVGRSAPMLKVLETIAKVARSDSSVLILGESGTGKELVAAAIHRLSQRSDRPYVTLNSSAIPESLLESELFGHEKGAFTSADRRRVGRFEEAVGGTLFLDEIGDMPFTLQAKLLRVLQDKRYTPLGGNESREADVRIVAATNMDLDQGLKRGSFRLDLYYRLAVLPITIPSLRERADDIPDLLEHFAEVANRAQVASSACYFTDAAIRFLCRHQWPGNVRQLQNLVERLVVLKGGGAIDIPDLPREIIESTEEGPKAALGAFVPSPSATIPVPHAAAIAPPSSSRGSPLTVPRPLDAAAPARAPEDFGRLPEEGIDLETFIESLENDFIRQALERTGINRNQAAKLLGLNRTTLVERIKKRRLTTLNEPSKEL